jgi:polyhydroxybutyrate depolymerase
VAVIRIGKPMLLPTLAVLAWASLLAPGASARAANASPATTENFEGRELVLVAPSHPAAARALVIVLHGGFGRAERIASGNSESALNLNALAEKHGFYVAYLNGTKVGRMLPATMRGWNAGGGCCGLPFSEGVDDVAYIEHAVQHLVDRHGLDARHVYGLGHSNGAMMVQRLLCESQALSAGVAVAGPLNMQAAACPAMPGHRVLAIHGVDDRNVPVAGGVGTRGVARVAFQSEVQARDKVEAAGGHYTLQLVPGADHSADHIDAALTAAGQGTIGELAVRFFGLAAGTP